MYGYRTYVCNECDYEFKAYEGISENAEIPTGSKEPYLYATFPMHCPKCNENFSIDGYKKQVFCENCGAELELIIIEKGFWDTIFGSFNDKETDYFCPKCITGKLIRKKGVTVLNL